MRPVGRGDGRWPIAPATPTQKPTATFVPAACAGATAASCSSAGIRSDPRIRPTIAAEQADERAADGGRAVVERAPVVVALRSGGVQRERSKAL